MLDACIDGKVVETTIPKIDVKSIQGQGPPRVSLTDDVEIVMSDVQYFR